MEWVMFQTCAILGDVVVRNDEIGIFPALCSFGRLSDRAHACEEGSFGRYQTCCDSGC